MRIIGLEIPDDKQLQFSHLINIESIFSEYHTSLALPSRNPESSSNFLSNLESYIRSSFDPSLSPGTQVPQKLIDLIYSLSLSQTIRLYQIPQNVSQRKIEIKQLSDSLLKAALSLDDLIQKFYQNSNFPSEILCLMLPEYYELDCLNIFESFIQMGKLLWALKGILLIRGKFSACILKSSNKWVLNIIRFGTFTHSTLQAAISAAADNGFVPAAFWYFECQVNVVKEMINPQKIKAFDLIRLSFKEKNKKRFNFDLRQAILKEFQIGKVDVGKVCGYKSNIDAPFSKDEDTNMVSQNIAEMNKRLFDKVEEISNKTKLTPEKLPEVNIHECVYQPAIDTGFKTVEDDGLGPSMFPLYETVEKQQVIGLAERVNVIDIHEDSKPDRNSYEQIREFSIAIKRNRNTLNNRTQMEEIKEASLIAEGYQTYDKIQFYCQICTLPNGIEYGLCEHHICCVSCYTINFSNSQLCYNCQTQILR